MINKITEFIKEGVWLLPDERLGRLEVMAVKTLRVTLLSTQGFVKDLCPLRASALTLYTLLSIVPVIAMLFGIAKGFGFEKMLRDRLLEQTPEQDALMIQLIEFAENMLANTKGGVVAGIGVVLLLWTVIKVIGNIEESFNHIWKIALNRSWARKVSDYLSIMLLAPVLLIASGSITVFVKTQVTWLMEVMHLPEWAARLVLYGLSFSPFLIMAILFSIVFMFMPNRQVELKAAAIAGIVTGVLYQWVQWAYLSLQLGASSYNAIYGSFAALPLFLIWLQLGWFVVLLGCEISFYIQNYRSYCHNEKFSDLSLALRRNIALQVMHLIVTLFVSADEALNSEAISARLNLPLSVVQKTLQILLDSRLIVELKAGEDDSSLYQPAYDINQITVLNVIKALDTAGRNRLPADKGLDRFSSLNEEWFASLEHSDCNRLLKEI
ncbi:YihY/virulence factor BrkB family protein [Methylomarinum sp. Ch1-1]|uniref:YihY/virulence factor BrkB family protein n=1 Tax=Methylomarinum roseum TaxID=3067653 RepID=A0AAU7NR78_9GAMM|nr:YihY/virulence factor BrkB family protein [Methylomarinum sp. Ch1-1]MDP4520568.1 YihY/virulence factor BrkB family protein [Methylomarinum sp. Ch1-1]